MLVGLLLGKGAYAVDVGLITVNGAVVAATCSVTLGGSANPIIRLPDVPASSLAALGESSGDTEVVLLLSGCNFSTNATVIPYFIPGPNLSSSGGRLRNIAASPADNVELEFLLGGRPVNLAAANGAQDAGSVFISTSQTGGSLRYVVRYYATGVSTPGTVSSNMTWGVDYN